MGVLKYYDTATGAWKALAQGPKGDTGDKGDKGDPTTVNGKTGASITLGAADVGADVSGAASAALTSANNYTDSAVTTLSSSLGTAAFTPASDYATAAQGAKADSAIQTETDPTVPSWAKTPSKPTYTKSEVGLGNADNTSDVDKPVSTAQQTALNGKQNSDATLTALAAHNANGILTQTAADTFTGRTITGTANQVTVTNGDGVAGNPTLSLPQDIHEWAFPTFGGTTLNGQLNINSNNAIKLYSDVGVTQRALFGAGRNGDMTLSTPGAYNWLRIGNNIGTIGIWTDGNVGVNDTPQFEFNGTAFRPYTDSVGTLGTSSLYWSNTYTDKLFLNSTATLDGSTAGRATVTADELYFNGFPLAYQSGRLHTLYIGGGGKSNASGDGFNLSIGFEALLNTTSAAYNTAIGFRALRAATGGGYNTAIGVDAMMRNTLGEGNTAVGGYTLNAITSGYNNTAIGFSALSSITNSLSAIGIGWTAGMQTAASTALTSATDSIFIGSASKALDNSQTNQIVIGTNAVGNGSNTVTIGNSSVTGNFFSGNIESTTVSGGVVLKSPDGTRYKLTIANGGTVTVSAA